MKKMLEELKAKIEYYNDLYYNEHVSEISDYQYDEMVKRYNELVDDGDAKLNIGAKVTGFHKAKHSAKMYSLDNTYNSSDLEKVFNRWFKGLSVNKLDILYEPKFDGLALSIIYKKGKLHKAITRGDGTVGDDVTKNVMEIDNVPKNINNSGTTFVIRGEVVLPLSKFKEINDDPLEKNYSNARNLASGTLKQLDHRKIKPRGLQFIAYQIVGLKSELPDEENVLEYIGELGFKASPQVKDTISENVFNTIEDINSVLSKLMDADIETDGIVVKVNKRHYQDILGYTNKCPKYAMAYKFEAKKYITKLIDVEWSIGKYGTLTPVGILKTVNIDGVNIDRVTLHNYKFVKSMGVNIGDDVYIERAGEVIPHILGYERVSGSKPITPPTVCPHCGAPVKYNDGDNNPFCDNIKCPGVLIKKLQHFVARDAMNIVGLGGKHIEKLVKEYGVKSPLDLYLYTLTDCVNIFGDKIGYKIYNNIQASKLNTINKLIYSLSIPNIGRTISMKIYKLNKPFLELTIDDLDGIKIGDVATNRILNYIMNADNINYINKLISVGLDFNNNAGSMKDVDIKDGLHVCLTSIKGKKNVQNEYRSKLKEMLGKDIIFDDNFSKKTDVLIRANSSVNSSKVKKAIKMGIKILNLDEI